MDTVLVTREQYPKTGSSLKLRGITDCKYWRAFIKKKQKKTAKYKHWEKKMMRSKILRASEI